MKKSSLMLVSAVCGLIVSLSAVAAEFKVNIDSLNWPSDFQSISDVATSDKIYTKTIDVKKTFNYPAATLKVSVTVSGDDSIQPNHAYVEARDWTTGFLVKYEVQGRSGQPIMINGVQLNIFSKNE
ncbi:MAG: hypothetical protein HYW49_02665 [Deltaproteobacteria bacterium]|nr:hypothetical protein [Deltaproteobacteria bacterium]